MSVISNITITKFAKQATRVLLAVSIDHFLHKAKLYVKLYDILARFLHYPPMVGLAKVHPNRPFVR